MNKKLFILLFNGCSFVRSNYQFNDANMTHANNNIRRYTLYEPRCEKTGLRGLRPGPTQTWLYSHRRWLEA